MTSKYSIKNLIKDEGVTLVELLAAIAILSIIVTSFLAFFIQAANTNKQTNEVNEATFLAQERIEQLTYYSSNKSLEETRVDLFKSNDPMIISEPKNGFTIETKLSKSKKEDETSNLYTAIVIVYEGEIERGKPRAQMETRLSFNDE